MAKSFKKMEQKPIFQAVVVLMAIAFIVGTFFGVFLTLTMMYL